MNNVIFAQPYEYQWATSTAVTAGTPTPAWKFEWSIEEDVVVQFVAYTFNLKAHGTSPGDFVAVYLKSESGNSGNLLKISPISSDKEDSITEITDTTGGIISITFAKDSESPKPYKYQSLFDIPEEYTATMRFVSVFLQNVFVQRALFFTRR